MDLFYRIVHNRLNIKHCFEIIFIFLKCLQKIYTFQIFSWREICLTPFFSIILFASIFFFKKLSPAIFYKVSILSKDFFFWLISTSKMNSEILEDLPYQQLERPFDHLSICDGPESTIPKVCFCFSS